MFCALVFSSMTCVANIFILRHIFEVSLLVRHVDAILRGGFVFPAAAVVTELETAAFFSPLVFSQNLTSEAYVSGDSCMLITFRVEGRACLVWTCLLHYYRCWSLLFFHVCVFCTIHMGQYIFAHGRKRFCTRGSTTYHVYKNIHVLVV